MLAAVFKNIHQLELADYDLRLLKNDEVLIKVNTCGVCGTDFHIYSGQAKSNPPVILGHEYAGIIADTGKKDSEFNIGDKIAIDPNIQCGFCNYCRSGQPNFCENLQALGVTTDGGFAEFSIVPKSQAYKLPQDFPLDIASFAEPVSCCLRGIEQANIKPGESAVIVGGGTIGLLMLQLIANAGAKQIIIIEPIEKKRLLAKQLGADYCFSSSDADLKHKINDITKGGVDISIECAGNSQAAQLAVELPKRGGRVVLFGLANKAAYINLNLQDIFLRELSIQGSLLNPYTFQRAVDLLITDKLKVKDLISDKFQLSQIDKVFNNTENSKMLKQQIIIN